ncbi:MAG: ABC-F family ATP-binding cassette domain-containing protein [Verrucomicrobiota bacterium]|nr:ABC-F family ATP-binding cassette domain-containing protein [Verrucomicrobiota bacterium]
MIEFQNIGVHYGTQEVLGAVNFRINAGERVGIVGPNGSGKSTLFRLILGEAQPDTGAVAIEQSPRIGHIRQHLVADSEQETLLEYALRGIPGLAEMEHELHALGIALSEPAPEPARARMLARLGEVQTAFEHLGGYEVETRVKVSLGGLGFDAGEFGKPFKSFSGGWQMRAELSRVLASQPDLLLLDEPSNYLDLPAVEWLQRFLRNYDGTLVLISHDRYLLRTLTTTTVEVDAHTATRYSGDLDFYLRERDVRHANLLAAKENQDRRREQLQRFVDRFKAQATKAVQAQSRMKMIERLDEEAIVLPRRSLAAGYLRLAPAPHAGAEIVRLENVSFSYDGVRNVLHDVNLSIARGDKVAIVGYNGMGKTTLLRIMAGVRAPSSGRCVPGHKVLPGYLSQEFSETVSPEVSVFECAKRCRPELTERDLRAQLGGFGFSADDIGKPAGVLSGGEKIRLAFLRLFLAPPNFMLLDEPTTHLDLEGRTTLEKAIRAYDGTVCLVSHDIEFVRNTVTSIIEISPGGVRRFPGGYDYYREKIAQEGRGGGGAPAQPPRAETAGGPSSAAPADPAHSSKELRRLRAQERAKFQPRIRALKGNVVRAEARIAELEAELETLSGVLFNPTPETDFAATNKRLKIVQDQLSAFSEEWERDATELERLQKKMNEETEGAAD